MPICVYTLKESKMKGVRIILHSATIVVDRFVNTDQLLIVGDFHIGVGNRLVSNCIDMFEGS